VALIAIDSSSWIAYLTGRGGRDVDAICVALEDEEAALPPVVLTELLSDPALSIEAARFFKELPLLTVVEGYWERAGFLRARVVAAGRKARMGDVLVAQSCLDYKVPLITRDRDFHHFARLAGLKLLLGG
jgi:predicted nucleic acid-binding protein